MSYEGRGSGAVGASQGHVRLGSLPRRAGLCLAVLALAGCQSVERMYDSHLTASTPVDWWHQMQGGAIAHVRPPPPGIGQPYPNLDQLPAALPVISGADRRALAAQLAAQRDRVQREAAQQPLAGLPPPKPAAAPAAAPDPGASKIVADAASAPAAPTPSNSPAPPPSPAVRSAASAASAAGPLPAISAAGPLPAIPDAPPAPPNLPGIAIDTTQPAGRPAPPGVTIRFARGSAVLSPAADAVLGGLAARRGGGPVAVRAGGDSGPSARSQAAALPLALRRAHAVAAALVAAGVPATAIHATAVATARDTRIDLIQ